MLFGREIDAIYIAAQLIGFAAMGFGIYSYQMRRRINILIFQSLSNLFWVLQYLLLGTASAVVALALGILRNVVYMLRGVIRFADSVAVPVIFSVAFAVSGIFTYQNIFDILPTVGMILASLAFFCKKEQHIRLISLFVAASWLTFGIAAGSIASMVADSITLVSILVSLIRYETIIRKNKNSTSSR